MSDDRKVVSLRGGKIVSLKPDPDVVEALEKFLEAARSGDVVGVFMAVLHRDDSVSGRRCGTLDYRISGIVTQMHHDMCARRSHSDDCDG